MKLAPTRRRHPDLNPLRGLGPQSGPSLSQSNIGSSISKEKNQPYVLVLFFGGATQI